MKNGLFLKLSFLSFLSSSCAIFSSPQRQQTDPGPRITRMGFEYEGENKNRASELILPELLLNWNTNPSTEHLLALTETEHQMNLDSSALTRLNSPLGRKLTETSPSLKLLMAEIYYRLELFEIAVQHYKQILQSEEKSLLIRWRLYSCYEKLGSFQQALLQLQKLQPIEPDQSFVNYKRGKILSLINKSDLEPAIEEYQKAIQLKPDFKSAHLELAELLMQTGRFEESARLLDRLERRFGPDVDVYLLAGEASLRVGDYEDAERRFLVLSKSESFRLQAYKKLSELYSASQNINKQIWALTEALRIDMADDQLRLQLTFAHLQNRQVLEAQKYALEISPQSDFYIEGQKSLILYFEKNQDQQSAQIKRQQLAQKFPDHPIVKDFLSNQGSNGDRSPATAPDATEAPKNIFEREN